MENNPDQIFYNVVKSAFFTDTPDLTAISILTDVMGIPLQDIWGITNPSNPNESIGGLILQTARQGVAPDNLRYRRPPQAMLQPHTDELLDAFYECNSMLDLYYGQAFLENIPLGDEYQSKVRRLLMKQWKIVQREVIYPHGRYNFYAIGFQMRRWQFVNDVTYTKLPEDWKVPRNELTPDYALLVMSFYDDNEWPIRQEQVDLVIERNLNGANPTVENRYGMVGLNDFDLLDLLRSGIVFPRVDVNDYDIQFEFPDLVAWQDGRYIPERHSRVRRIAKDLEKEFGIRSQVLNETEVIPRDLMEVVMMYEFGTAPPSQAPRFAASRQQYNRSRRRAALPPPQYVFPDNPEDIAYDRIMAARQKERKSSKRRRSSLEEVRKRRRRRPRSDDEDE